MRVDQFVPGFALHDAIGNHVLQVRRTLRAAGFESDIFGGEWLDPRLRSEARPFLEWEPSGPDGALLYHSSTHSGMAAWLAERVAEGRRLMTDYHNITPASFFARWLPDAAASMSLARSQLVELTPHVELAMADSRFNEQELIDLGYAKTATCRLLVDLDAYHDPPDPKTLARLSRRRDAGGAQWLFVGRIAPNKCQHDVIAAFAVYRRLFDRRARLTFVGGISAPRYASALQALAGELELGAGVEMLDGVTHDQLLAHFATADVFVCLSEHEGFCVPILEAMELGLPVVAYAAAAVPETVAGAGVLVEDKDPLEVACAVADLLGDAGRREATVAAGRARAAEFALERTSGALLDTVSAHLGA